MARILGSLLSHAYGALGGNDHSAAAARKLIRKLEESPKADFRELSGGRSRRKLMDNRIALWILSLGVACIGGWVFHVTDASMPIGQQRLPYGLWAVAGVFLFGSLFAKRLVITPQSVRLESILGTSRVMSFNRIEGCRVEVSKVTKDGRDIIDASIQIAVGGELVGLPIVQRDHALMIARLFEPEQREVVDQYFTDNGLETLRHKKRKARRRKTKAETGSETEPEIASGNGE